MINFIKNFRYIAFAMHRCYAIRTQTRCIAFCVQTLHATSLLAILLFFGCTQPQPQLRVATASNMQYAIQKLTQTFTQQTGIPCEIITGSSGKLTAQIQQGAPYDIFVAADMTYPNILFKNNFTTTAPKIYAYGELVLWSMKSKTAPTLPMLCLPEIKHIAIANPKTAPYGLASIEVLKKTDLLDSITSKLVYGESIAQASQFVFSQTATIGFTAKSVVMAPTIKNQGHWSPINQKLYTPLAQGIVLLKNDKQQSEEVQQFYNFMFSDQATAILNTFGYSRTAP